MKVHKKSLGFDENVYDLNYSDDSTCIFTCRISCKYVYLLYINYASIKLF